MNKQKVHTGLYWFFTIWFSFGMLTAGIFQTLKVPAEIELMTALGYPVYFLTVLGVSKILGVVAILAPTFPLLKEWAYAGFVFTLIGAAFSHASVGHPFSGYFPVILLLVLCGLSWYLRPASRKVSV